MVNFDLVRVTINKAYKFLQGLEVAWKHHHGVPVVGDVHELEEISRQFSARHQVSEQELFLSVLVPVIAFRLLSWAGRG